MSRPNDKIFALEVAKGEKLVTAYLRAFPDEKDKYTMGTIYNKASELMKNGEMVLEVEAQKEYLNTLANRAIGRIGDIITNGKEHNALAASIWTAEQVHGKATQRTVVVGKHVMVTYDLSGGQAGAVPQEVLDQLNSSDTP